MTPRTARSLCRLFHFIILSLSYVRKLVESVDECYVCSLRASDSNMHFLYHLCVDAQYVGHFFAWLIETRTWEYMFLAFITFNAAIKFTNLRSTSDVREMEMHL